MRYPMGLLACLMVTVLGCDTWDTRRDRVEGATAQAALMAEELCADVDDWPIEWAAREAEAVELVNAQRAKGADCKELGVFAPTGPVQANPQLICAARRHARDMATRHYMAHDTPDGITPWQRLTAAGYSYRTANENIAAGAPTAVEVMQMWINHPPHCINVMDPNMTEIGVGYAEPTTEDPYGRYWAQDFGAPLPEQ